MAVAAQSEDAPRTRVIGLTGGIASGKSTVGRILRSLGAEVIDADEVARAVVEPGRPAYKKIVAEFGPEILKPAAQGLPPIDRERLAARVFSDDEARRRLNSITHPEIGAESARRMQEFAARGGGVVIYEATLLVENKAYLGLDGLIVVDIPETLQLERAIHRGLPQAQAEARMRAQATRRERRSAANWLIDNQGDEAATRSQVEALWPELQHGQIPPPGHY